MGIALTALACAGFLWWWFTPVKPLPPDESGPMTWVAAAQKETANGAQTIGVDYDLLFVARQLRIVGEDAQAAQAGALVQHAALRRLALDEIVPQRLYQTSSTPLLREEVQLLIDRAREAYDQLEFDQAAQLISEARAKAAERPELSERTTELASIAAAEYQLGTFAGARETLTLLGPSKVELIKSMPAALAREFARSDAVAIVLLWLEQAPPGGVEMAGVAQGLAQTLEQRLLQREDGELAKQASLADPGAPLENDRKRREDIWKAIGQNDLARARTLAESAPPGSVRAGAYLTMARALLWQKQVSNENGP